MRKTKLFELIYKSGPHGDQCTTYNVKLFNNTLLADFINDVIKSNPEEWGSFYVKYPDENNFLLYEKCEIQYKYGKLTKSYYPRTHYNKNAKESDGLEDPFINNLSRKIINSSINNYANGGWSLMNYFLTVN